jgi:hypothetical protein
VKLQAAGGEDDLDTRVRERINAYLRPETEPTAEVEHDGA